MNDEQKPKKITFPKGDSYMLVYPKKWLLSDKEFEELKKMKPETVDFIRMLGKKIPLPRYQQNYGASYTYTGKTYEAIELKNETLIRLMQKANEHAWRRKLVKKTQSIKNVLVNWYMDGNHYIGFHSDNESQFVENSPIYSLSYGATRKFIIKDAKTKETVYELNVEDGMMIVMCGEMQKYYKHGVPKTKKCKELRINITMRFFEK